MQNQEPLTPDQEHNSDMDIRRETAHPFNPQNLARIKGRMGRLDYAILYFFLFFLTLFVQKLMGVNPFLVGASALTEEKIISASLLKLGNTINLLGVLGLVLLSIKRFHDINYSGWLALVFVLPMLNLGLISLLIAFVGIILRLILLFAKGEPQTNRYGSIPDGNKRNKLLMLFGVLIIVFITYSNLFSEAKPVIEPIIEQLVQEMQQQ